MFLELAILYGGKQQSKTLANTLNLGRVMLELMPDGKGYTDPVSKVIQYKVCGITINGTCYILL